MNAPFPSRGQVEYTRSCYPPGTRIMLGRLAMWRLQTHSHFGGIWLSDYVPNRLGGFVPEQEQEPVKPDCPLIGRNGNIHNLLGIAGRTLREHGMRDQAVEMFQRVALCQSYDSALSIIGDYVNVTSVKQTENMDTLTYGEALSAITLSGSMYYVESDTAHPRHRRRCTSCAQPDDLRILCGGHCCPGGPEQKAEGTVRKRQVRKNSAR